MKEDHRSRLDYYKTYKILCKLLHCSSLNYSPMTRASKRKGKATIWGETWPNVRVQIVKRTSRGLEPMSLRKNASMEDVQLQIVKHLLKVLEKHSISAGKWTIKCGSSFDRDLMLLDLNGGRL